MISALILAHILTTNTVAAAQPVLLRYKFHPGQSRTYKMSMDMDMKMDMGGQKMPVKMDMSSVTKQTVKSVNSSGSAAMSVSVVSQSMVMKMNGQERPMPIAANKEAAKLTMSPTGTVSGIDLGKNAPASNPMGMMGGGNALSSLQMTGALPSQPVSVGSHWATTANLMGGNLQMTSHLDKVATEGGHTIAYLSCGGDVDMGKVLGAVGGANGLSGAGTMKSDIHYRFDVTSGSVLDVHGVMNMNMNMSSAKAAKGAMTMSGVMHLKMNLVQ